MAVNLGSSLSGGGVECMASRPFGAFDANMEERGLSGRNEEKGLNMIRLRFSKDLTDDKNLLSRESLFCLM